jgi:hypothetical protein
VSSTATHADVLAGRADWSAECADALAWLKSLPDRCVSLVFFSPPYSDARTYGIGFKLRGQAWVDWMRPIVAEAARVSCGLVGVNATAPVKKQSYTPAVEWLVSDLTRRDGLVCGPSPYAWVRSGTPGSGNRQYQRRCWEPIYCFALPDRLPLAWSDNTAFGKPPKYGPGGAFSNRQADGSRVNQWGGTSKSGSGRKRDGTIQPAGRPSHKFTSTRRRQGTDERETMEYTPPTIANPGNVIRTHSGKNHAGHDLAHENEAPMSLAVAERFVHWFVPKGGIVADPFGGSFTTAHAAINHGRRFIGCDVRESQVDLGRRRLRSVTPTLFGSEVSS